MNTFEQQANIFGVNAFAPRNFVWCLYSKLFGMDRKIRFYGPTTYTLTCEGLPFRLYLRHPIQLAWIIAKRIQPYFWGLSIQCLTYQVLRVAVDNNGYAQGSMDTWGAPNSIGEILEQL